MIWLILYALAMLIACLWHSGDHSDNVAYYVCGRKAKAPAVAFSIMASCIGGSATIGMVGLAWECGTPAFWWLGSGVFGLTILAILLAKKIRFTKALTLPGVIELFLGQQCKVIAAFVTLCASIAVVAAQFSALGIIIAPLMGCSTISAVCAGALFLTIYTFIGGQQAVIRSDIWQFLILAMALVLALYLFLRIPACMDALVHLKLEFSNKDIPPRRVLYFLLIFGASFIIGPMIFGRILSAASPEAAQKGSFWAAIGMAVMAALISCLGICLQGLHLDIASREDALFTAIKQSLPSWAYICVTLGLSSAIISSADSCLMTAATVSASGLLKHGNVPFTRVCMCIISTLALLLALAGKGILALLLAASNIYVCGVVPAVFVAILSGRASPRARLLYMLAMLSGGAFGLAAAVGGQEFYSFLGMGIAFILSCGGAYVDRIPSVPKT